MKFLEKISEMIKNKNELIDENIKIRKGKFEVEQKFNEMFEDLNTIKSKYIELLEQKSENFDLYVKYQNICEDLSKDKKELKKQVAQLTENINSKNEELSKFSKEINKLKNAKKKCD